MNIAQTLVLENFRWDEITLKLCVVLITGNSNVALLTHKLIILDCIFPENILHPCCEYCANIHFEW